MNWTSRPAVPALLAGIALLLSFPGFSWSFLAWPALLPYLLFLAGRPKWRSALGAHLVLSGVWFGGVLYWIPRVPAVHGGFSWPASAALFLLMLAVLALFLLPFTLLTRWAAANGPGRALLAAPGAWTLSELLRARFVVGGFPWAPLGASQPPDSHWSQIADLGGVHAVGFLIVATAAAGAGLLQKKPLLRPARWALVLWVACGLYGVYRVHFWRPPEAGSIKVALVQPGIAQEGDREDFAREHFETLPKHYAAAVEEGAQWVVFPESPNPFVYGRDFYYTTFWSRLVSDHRTPLLLPGPAVVPPGGHRRNSAFLLSAEGNAAYRYDKVHLVPFGEYLPWGEVLGFAAPLVRDVGGFEPGEPGTAPGEVAGIRFGVLICYEAIFPELARDQVRRGAQLLVNVTNDAWFGQTSAPRQHLELAAWRAVETRKPLLRAANSGITAFVDPWGVSGQQLALNQTGNLIADVPANSWRTLYSYLGDWLVAILAAATLAAALPPRKRRARAKKRRTSRSRPKSR